MVVNMILEQPRNLARGRAGEMGLVGEVEVGEFSDGDVEAAVGVGEVLGLDVGEAGAREGWDGSGGGEGEGGADEEALAHRGAGLEVVVVVEAAEDGLPAIFRQIFPRPPRPRHLLPQSFHGSNVKSVLTKAAWDEIEWLIIWIFQVNDAMWSSIHTPGIKSHKIDKQKTFVPMIMIYRRKWSNPTQDPTISNK